MQLNFKRNFVKMTFATACTYYHAATWCTRRPLYVLETSKNQTEQRAAHKYKPLLYALLSKILTTTTAILKSATPQNNRLPCMQQMRSWLDLGARKWKTVWIMSGVCVLVCVCGGGRSMGQWILFTAVYVCLWSTWSNLWNTHNYLGIN